MKKYLLSFIALLTFSFYSKGQVEEGINPILQLDPSIGVLHISNTVLDEALGMESKLPEWCLGGGFSLRYQTDIPIVGILSFNSFSRTSSEGEAMYLGSYTALLGWRLDLNNNLNLLPTIGYQGISGLYEQEVTSFVGPGPSLVGNYRKWFFQQGGVMLGATLDWKLGPHKRHIVPHSLFINLQYGLPIGPGLLEYSGANPIVVERKPLFAYNLSLSFGVSYRLIGASGKQ